MTGGWAEAVVVRNHRFANRAPAMRGLVDDAFTRREIAVLAHGGLLRLPLGGLLSAAMVMPIRTNMPLGAFLNVWADLGRRDFSVHMSVYVVIAMLMSVIGPFNTGEDPFLWRFSYWTVMLGVFGGIIMPLTARLLRNSASFRGLSIFSGGVAALGIAAVPMTTFVGLCDGLFRHAMETVEYLPFADIDLVRARFGSVGAMQWTDGALLYLHVLAIAILSTGLVSLFIVRGAHPASPHRDAASLAPRAGARFLSRLPAHIGAEIVYLQMADHYVRVVTTAGSALLLMRLRDAIDELEGVAGLQVHRSWWVAADHIVRLARDGRRNELQMSDGTMVPVSASYRAAVDALLMQPAGLLASAA